MSCNSVTIYMFRFKSKIKITILEGLKINIASNQWSSYSIANFEKPWAESRAFITKVEYVLAYWSCWPTS